MKEFNYRIIKRFATISESSDGRFALELNRISYNESPPKMDLRRWDRKKGMMLKGLTLTEMEAKGIMSALEHIFNSKEDME